MLIVFYITAAAVSRRHEAVETAMDSLERSLGDLIEHRRVHTEGSVPAKKPLLRNLAANSDAHMITYEPEAQEQERKREPLWMQTALKANFEGRSAASKLTNEKLKQCHRPIEADPTEQLTTHMESKQLISNEGQSWLSRVWKKYKPFVGWALFIIGAACPPAGGAMAALSLGWTIMSTMMDVMMAANAELTTSGDHARALAAGFLTALWGTVSELTGTFVGTVFEDLMGGVGTHVLGLILWGADKADQFGLDWSLGVDDLVPPSQSRYTKNLAAVADEKVMHMTPMGKLKKDYDYLMWTCSNPGFYERFRKEEDILKKFATFGAWACSGSPDGKMPGGEDIRSEMKKHNIATSGHAYGGREKNFGDVWFARRQKKTFVRLLQYSACKLNGGTWSGDAGCQNPSGVQIGAETRWYVWAADESEMVNGYRTWANEEVQQKVKKALAETEAALEANTQLGLGGKNIQRRQTAVRKETAVQYFCVQVQEQPQPDPAASFEEAVKLTNEEKQCLRTPLVRNAIAVKMKTQFADEKSIGKLCPNFCGPHHTTARCQPFENRLNGPCLHFQCDKRCKTTIKAVNGGYLQVCEVRARPANCGSGPGRPVSTNALLPR